MPTQFKMACRVNQQFDGLAHIVQAAYDGNFSTWYGKLSVAATIEEAYPALFFADLFLQFEDGRVGRVRTMSSRFEARYFCSEDEPPGESCEFYFVGLSPLCVPPASPAER